MARRSRRVLALAFGLAAAWPAAATEPAPPARPGYRELRFDEDWSVLADPGALPSRDPFDPLKYVELSDSVWVSFGGQLRGRFESWESYDFRSDGVAFLSRILAHADFHFGESARFFIEGKSAGATTSGVFDGTHGLDEDWLDLQNAFLELSGERLRFRLGRQELAFGRQRLVSPLDWANARRTFDGATLEWLGEDWHTTLFANRPVQVKASEWNGHSKTVDAFYGVHATRPARENAPRFDAYVYGLEPEEGRDRFATVGGRVADAFGDTPFDYDLEAAVQAGRHRLMGMFASQLGWWLAQAPLSPRFFAGFDYASADGSDRFDQLFPLGHAYFGAIDIVGRSNILSPSLGVTTRPLPAVTAELVAYGFWLDDPHAGLIAADNRLVRGRGRSAYVGTELDLVAKWQLDPHTALFAGYAHFFPGSFIRQTGPDGATDFFYGMVQYTF